MKKQLKMFLFLLAVSVIPVLCQASTTILSNASPNHTVLSGSNEKVYGTSASNQITLESGAKAALINFPGQNSIQIQASSDMFTVSRSGTVVTFQGSDETILKIPATKDAQTIFFNGEESRVMLINNNQVMLDDQVISTTPASIEGNQEPIDQPPAAATQISPTGTVSTNTPTYTWNAVSNASHYYLFPTDSISSILYSASDAGCSSGTGSCSITPGIELVNDGYTWYVQSYNSYGSLPLSGGMNFTVAFSPGWSSGAPMTTGRNLAASAVVGNDIYVIGGTEGTYKYNAVEKYDTRTDSWASLSSMPFANFSHRGATVDGKIFVFGGAFDGTIVYRFDPSSEQWTRLGDKPDMDWMGAPAVVNNKVYLFGGYVSGTASNMALEYDPATDSWNTKAYMPSARYAPATAVYNNKIYVIGGNYGNKNNEMYDPETNTWETKAELPFSNNGWGVAGEINGKIYFVDSPTDKMAVYSPTSDSWISIGGLNTPRHNLTGEVVNEKLFVLGGGYLFNNFDLVDIYTPSDLQSASFQTKSDAVYKIEVDDSYMSDFFYRKHIADEKAAMDLMLNIQSE